MLLYRIRKRFTCEVIRKNEKKASSRYLSNTRDVLSWYKRTGLIIGAEHKKLKFVCVPCRLKSRSSGQFDPLDLQAT